MRRISRTNGRATTASRSGDDEGSRRCPAHHRLESAPTGAQDNQTTATTRLRPGHSFSGASLGHGKANGTPSIRCRFPRRYALRFARNATRSIRARRIVKRPLLSAAARLLGNTSLKLLPKIAFAVDRRNAGLHPVSSDVTTRDASGYCSWPDASRRISGQLRRVEPRRRLPGQN